MSHDTQKGQAVDHAIQPWFIPHAYALILLRPGEGYPCVFYGDLFGICPPHPRAPACGGKLARIVLARKLFAYGKQRDYFDNPDCIGWTLEGHRAHSDGAGLAVLISNSWDVEWKRMNVGGRHSGEKWTDVMNWGWGEVPIDKSGFGWFPVGPRSMGVWTNRRAQGRQETDILTYPAGAGRA